jgi:hypothetical protein
MVTLRRPEYLLNARESCDRLYHRRNRTHVSIRDRSLSRRAMHNLWQRFRIRISQWLYTMHTWIDNCTVRARNTTLHSVLLVASRSDGGLIAIIMLTRSRNRVILGKAVKRITIHQGVVNVRRMDYTFNKCLHRNCHKATTFCKY